MQLSKKAIQDFRKIYQEDYGVALSDEEALALATSFLNFMRVICHPIPEEDCSDAADVLY